MKFHAFFPPAALIGAIGAAYGLSRSLAWANCLLALAAVVIAAIPVWVDRYQDALFERRALLAGTTVEGSWFRRVLWKGHVTAALAAVTAIAWAALLLALGWLLPPLQWAVIGAVGVVVALLLGPVTRWLSRHVLPGQVGKVARLWPLRWLNLAVLAIAFAVIDFHLGGQDTREMTWQAAAQQAFADHRDGLPCAVAGWLVGTLAALDALAWHAWQSFIPALGGRGLRIAAWLAVLLQAGVFAMALTRFQMGVLALVERAAQGRAERRREPLPVGIAALVFATLVLGLVLTTRAPERLVSVLPDPCAADAGQALLLQVSLNADVQAARDRAATQADARIDAELDRLYGEVEQGVDRYLDWYFSIVGEYARLWKIIVTRGADDYLSAQLQQQLFDRVRFPDRVAALTADVSTDTRAALGAVATRVRDTVSQRVQAMPCALKKVHLPLLAELEGDAQRAGAASLGGAIAPVIGRKAATGALAAIAATQAFRQSAGLLGVVTRRTVSGAPMLACVFTGAFQPLCTAVVGVLVWLGLDTAALQFSEAVFRPKMKEDLLAAVRHHQADLATALKHRHLLEVEAMARSIRRSVDGAFIPARDGI